MLSLSRRTQVPAQAAWQLFSLSRRRRSATLGALFQGKAAPTKPEHPGRRVDQLAIPEATKQNLYGLGFTKLYDIQARAFNPILRGRNFIGRSRTGTGKTIAYLLPVMERLRQQKMTAPHAVLILVPTRELCKQVGSTVVTLAVNLDVALVYGGPSLASQEQLVRLGPSVVVSTPGRCARLATRGALETKNVQVLVVDEADSMLGAEFFGRVEKVIAAVAKPQLQGIFFSASLPNDVLGTIERYFQNCEVVDLVDTRGLRGAAAVQTVAHQLCKVPKVKTLRMRSLVHFLFAHLSLDPGARCIIFVESTAEAKALLTHPALDRRTRALHSDSTTQDRDTVLTSFANREFNVLISTDIVARGVDFEDVALVLQMHPPRDPHQYLHRAGRTGRAGKGGTCLTLYDGSEHMLVSRIRDVTKQEFSIEAAPGPSDLHAASIDRLLDELFSVREEEYTPLLDDAASLVQESGPQVLAAAMAILDSRRMGLERAAQQAPSILTGRRGFVCLLAYDPEVTVTTAATTIKKVVTRMLRGGAGEEAVGSVVRTSDGWAFDVDQRRATLLLEDIRSGKQSAPFEITVPKQLPRLLRSHGPGRRRSPWAAMRERAFRLRRSGKAVAG